MKQISFAQAEHQNNKKVTRREVFPTRLIFLIQFSDSGIVGRLFDQAPHEVTKNHKKAWADAQAIDQNSFSAMLLTHPRNYTGQPPSYGSHLLHGHRPTPFRNSRTQFRTSSVRWESTSD